MALTFETLRKPAEQRCLYKISLQRDFESVFVRQESSEAQASRIVPLIKSEHFHFHSTQ